MSQISKNKKLYKCKERFSKQKANKDNSKQVKT